MLAAAMRARATDAGCGDTPVEMAVLEALRPWRAGLDGADGAVATITTIVATSGPSLKFAARAAAQAAVGWLLL